MQLENNKKIGRPSTLTRALSLQIRSLYLSGQNIKNIQLELGINHKTWEGWYYEDIQGFRSKFNEWKREKMLNKAEQNISDTLDLETSSDASLIRLKFTASVFIAETLGKESYSRKIIQEDPNKASGEELDELRRNIKDMMVKMRDKKSIFLKRS